MFPYYNQQQSQNYQPMFSQNPYFMFPQQTFQPHPSFNNFPQYHPNMYLNYAANPQIPKPNHLNLENNVENNPTIQNSPQNTKVFSCNCTNTDCRKQYCICFKNGQICGSKCGCSSCRNKELDDRNLVLQKKKNLSCNCKKSQCAKKYCQCYASGMKCGQSCHCSGCRNC